MISNSDLILVEFIKKNAFNKNNCVLKEDILNEIDFDNKEDIFNKLVSKNIIIKFGDKYFYRKNYKLHKFLKLLFLGIVIIFLIFNFFKYNIRYKSITFSNLSYEIPVSWEEVNTNNMGRYYVPSKDKSGMSGIIYVSYNLSSFLESDWELFMNMSYEKYLLEVSSDKDKIKKSSFILNNSYRVIEIDLNNIDKSIDKFYFILRNNEYVLIHSTDYNNLSVEDIDIITDHLLKKFNWDYSSFGFDI